MDFLSPKETTSLYGKARSPLVLKDEFKPLVKESGLEKYIDTTSFKTYLYEHGKSLQDYVGILGLYLFEKNYS